MEAWKSQKPQERMENNYQEITNEEKVGGVRDQREIKS